MTDHRKVADWYNEKYSETGDDTRRSIEAFDQVKKKLPLPPAFLLDIGCGRGEWLEHLHQSGYEKLAGIDVSEEAIQFVKAKLPHADLKVAPGEKLPFEDHHFDVVTCLGVLEHFLDIPKGLREIKRVLKPDAAAIIMVPNRKFIGWIFKSGEEKGTQQKEISETLYSVKEWTRLMEEAGLKVETVIADKGFIYNTKDIRTKGTNYYLKRLLHFILPLLPIALVYQVIFVVRHPAINESIKN